jgi:salicylate hydroxylase
LLRAGCDVHVYEQVHELREVGAGIAVSPNSTRVLHKLGLADALAALGVRPKEWLQRRWDDGRVLLREPLLEKTTATFGFPHYQCHRADLQRMLADALPPERLHFGHHLSGLADRGDRVDAEFANGTRVGVDMLVGADGIHSTVRSALFGQDDPRFTGCIAYRGLVPSERVRHLGLEVNMEVWMGPGRHFVHYYVQSERLHNFVCVIEQDTWRSESWTEPGKVADALLAYKGWHPQVRGIIEAVDETFIWALFDREPLSRWSVGRVTLLGDACHPMLPFVAQGSAQAIEDGAALATLVARSEGKDIPQILRQYESVRLPRTSRVQALATKNKQQFHLPDGPAQQERDSHLANGTAGFALNAISWIYGHDAVAEASQAPLRP